MRNIIVPFGGKKKMLSSEEEVLRRIGAKDFRSLNKKAIIEFVSSIDQMDPQVALAIIEKFPEIAQFGLNVAKEQTEQLRAVLASNDESVRAQYEQTKMVATILQGVLDNESSTPEERIEAMRGLDNVLAYNERIDKRNKKFLGKVFGTVLAFGTVIATIVFGAIGLSSKGSLPDHDDEDHDDEI